ncbi:hypothetical protein CDG79_18750 [Nostoc sp. 'Peltigera membranacea cyanobiont' 232]|nr:hypothetical protein CDG79_18750 [Nostoc sp. 'Peltigera membranacea cyanobiont' 232]
MSSGEEPLSVKRVVLHLNKFAMGLLIPLKSAKSVQVQQLTMTNPTKLLRSGWALRDWGLGNGD